MLGWLAEWLKQVIFIILLATFVDLLLPGKVMERYVRTVIGLFILMILLSPILTLFHRHWDMNQLAASLEKLGRNEAKVESVSQIMHAGDQLRADEQKQSQQLAESRIAQMIQSGLQQKLALPVQKVMVKTAVDAKGQNKIEHILVVLAASGSADHPPAQPTAISGAEPDKITIPEIKPVQPVQIHIDIDSIHTAQSDASVQGSVPAVSSIVSGQVKAQVSTVWEVDPAIIEVQPEKP